MPSNGHEWGLKGVQNFVKDDAAGRSEPKIAEIFCV